MKKYMIVCDDDKQVDLLFGRFLNMFPTETGSDVKIDFTRHSIRVKDEMFIRFINHRRFYNSESHEFKGVIFDGSVFELYLNKNKKGLLTNVT